MTTTRGIVSAGTDIQTPAGLFNGLTLSSMSGPAFEILEDGNPVSVGHTFGAGVVIIRRSADGNPAESGFAMSESGGSGAGGGSLSAITTVSLGDAAEDVPSGLSPTQSAGIILNITANAPTTIAGFSVMATKSSASDPDVPDAVWQDSVGHIFNALKSTQEGDWATYALPQTVTLAAGDTVTITIAAQVAFFTAQTTAAADRALGGVTVGASSANSDGSTNTPAAFGTRIYRTQQTLTLREKTVVGPLDQVDFPVVASPADVKMGGVAITKYGGYNALAYRDSTGLWVMQFTQKIG